MKQLLIVFCAIFTMFSAYAQPTEKALLWKVSGNGIKQPSYLYGTFHLLCANDLMLPDTLIAIIKTSKEVVFELKMDDPSMMLKMTQSMLMKDGHDLKEYIPQPTFDSVAAVFQHKTQLPLTAVSKYKPFIITALLYPSMLGCTPVGYETEIMKIAKQKELPIRGLETVEFQMQVFDDIPYSVQAKMLEKNLIDFADAVTQLKGMIAMYKTKNISLMQQQVADEADFGHYENVLLVKRNKNWIPQISKSVKENPVLFAVGAGHLGGENGLIQLLRKEGFILTPVLY